MHRGQQGIYWNIQQQRRGVLEFALEVFAAIDTANTGSLGPANISAYFRDYPESSVKLIMTAMDFDGDGVVTEEEWVGYWEYVRRAGYDDRAVTKTLGDIKAGTVFLNFPKAEQLSSAVPRQTLIHNIIAEIRKDGSLPVRLSQK